MVRPPLSLFSLCRPYLAIQLSAARGQILEWAARGAGLDARTATDPADIINQPEAKISRLILSPKMMKATSMRHRCINTRRYDMIFCFAVYML